MQQLDAAARPAPAFPPSIPARRGVLCGLATLPLIGCGVTSAGSSIASAHGGEGELITLYREWLPIAQRQRALEAILWSDPERFPDGSPLFLTSAAEHEALNKRNTALRRSIVSTAARTPEGVALKVRVFRWCCGEGDHYEEDTRMLDGEPPHDTTVARSIALDMARMNAAGRDWQA